MLEIREVENRVSECCVVAHGSSMRLFVRYVEYVIALDYRPFFPLICHSVNGERAPRVRMLTR